MKKRSNATNYLNVFLITLLLLLKKKIHVSRINCHYLRYLYQNCIVMYCRFIVLHVHTLYKMLKFTRRQICVLIQFVFLKLVNKFLTEQRKYILFYFYQSQKSDCKDFQVATNAEKFTVFAFPLQFFCSSQILKKLDYCQLPSKN